MDTIVTELRIYLVILIYMGIFQQPTTLDYWKMSDEYHQHRFTQYMTLTRFHQVKHFFHISPPSEPNNNDSWFSKVEPLSSKLGSAYCRYYVPSTDVSVDEMIVRFKGRFKHTFRMKNKPISTGYKIFSICDSGYTYSFLYTSRVNAVLGIQKVPGLNDTACAVYHLAKALPYRQRIQPLHGQLLLQHPTLYKTARPQYWHLWNSTDYSVLFPKTLKIKKGDRYDWNTLSGVVVQDKVLATFWMDNGPVNMLSTIHALSPDNDEWFVAKERRRRPRETSTNAVSVRAAIQGKPRATLRIPKITDDYNLNMNGICLSDQYRSYYDTQLTSRCT